MQLTVSEAARLLQVSNEVIYKWIRADGLPASRLGDRFHLNRVKVLEWAHENRIPLAVENGNGLPSLEAALRVGGVHCGIRSGGHAGVVREILSALPLPEGIDRDLLEQMILAREKQGSTAVGNGIAIPHARCPALLRVSAPLVALCYLDPPMEMGAPDGRPVFAFFVVVAATIRDHLHLLARLSMALHDEKFKQLIGQRLGAEQVLGRIRELESREARRSPGEKIGAS